jgi:hypothetical protein
VHDSKRKLLLNLWGALVALFTFVPGIAFAQAPVVNTISPPWVVKDSFTFTLTVDGSSFIAPTLGLNPAPGTVVRFPSELVPTGEALPTSFISSTQITAMVPGADTTLTRMDLARLTVLSQLSEQGITTFLNSTGGLFCSFADVACPGGPGVVLDSTGIAGGWRYIETMYRLGYTSGCSSTGDPFRRFCPAVSANLLATPGTYGVRAVNTVPLPLPVSTLTSAPVNFTVLASLPTPVPAVSGTGLVALLVALGVTGILAARKRGHV